MSSIFMQDFQANKHALSYDQAMTYIKKKKIESNTNPLRTTVT